MSTHRYSIGQTVRLTSRVGLSPKAADTYRVTETLPVKDRSPQYRLRNDELQQERVSMEKNLEAIETVSLS